MKSNANEEVPPGLENFLDMTCTTGTLPGKYRIKVNPDTKGVVHPVHRQPAALKPLIVEKLREMENQRIITRVYQPIEWVSSMVAVTYNSKRRICINPSDLSRVIRREHYPMRTIEEVLSAMPSAKIFSVLDVKSRFLQIELNEASPYLTMFNTVTGRFGWLRLLFGVKCASKLYQRIIDNMLSGIEGATASMDNIIVSGRTPEEHDAILREIVERATKYSLHLNFNKCQTRQQAVPCVGHLITSEGLKPDPSKVEAVHAMPAPTDKDGIRCFLGFVTYLSKFIPNLSEVNASLHQLLKADAEFAWQPAQQQAFRKLKDLCSDAPVLKFFDPSEICCDASSFGLEAVLLQNDQSIAFSSRSLIDAEKRYTQIKKETLSIIHASTKIHHYIFGK